MSESQIKIICNDARAITDNDNKYIRCHINIKHFNWLIEQAERVQELEKANKTLSDNYFQQIEQHKYLVQQNGRYREAIEYVMTANPGHYQSVESALGDINFVISELLEGK